MLLEFRVENYKCLADEQSLQLHAASHKKLLEQNTFPVLPGGGELRAVKSAVLYGANGGGKSSIVEAIRLMQQLIMNSPAYPAPGQPLPVSPFRLSAELLKSPSSFEATFLHDGIRYQYGFSITSERVEEEWLSAWPQGREQLWFRRRADTAWELGREFGGEVSQIQKATRPNALFLSTAANLNHEKAAIVRSYFANRLRFLAPLRWGWGAPAFPVTEPVAVNTVALSEERPDMKAAVAGLLRMADVGVRDFQIAAPPSEWLAQFPTSQREQIARGQKWVVTTHENPGEQPVEFSLQDESLGTQSLFSIAGMWIDLLKNGGTLFVDEFLSSLHPLLVRGLLKLVHEATSGAQLVMTTHDTNLLDPDLLRRDQVLFVEKDASGRSHLYSLLEFKARNDEAFEKGYLVGKYGAIPFLGTFRFGE